MDNYFNNGIIEAVRNGRHTSWKNAMTETEWLAWRDQLKTNRPKVWQEIIQMIDVAFNIINAHDKVLVLGGIAAHGLNIQQTKGGDDGLSEIILEYCMSLSTAAPNYNAGKVPSADVLKMLHTICGQIRDYLSSYYAIEHLTGKYTDLEHQMRFSMISETLFIRGDGYLPHLEEVFSELFGQHDDIFRSQYGFVSADILKTLKQLEASFCLRVTSPDKKPHPHFEYKLDKWKAETGGKANFPEDFAKKNPGIIVEDGRLMLYPLNWISYYDRLFGIRHFDSTQEKVADALTLKFGDNLPFSSIKPYSMLNPSKVYTLPVIKDEKGRQFFFSPNLAARNYFNIAQQLIKNADETYYNEHFLGNKTEKTKDRYVERKVMALFQQMLPTVKFYPNAKYTFKNSPVALKCAISTDGNYELDLIGVSTLATYLIEVKAGLIGEDSKRGAIKTLKKNLSNTIGDAICQAYRAELYIQNNEDCGFVSGIHKVIPQNKENIIRISVSFSSIGSLISSLIKLQQSGVIDSKAKLAWAVNLFDLIPVARILSGEKQFLDFISKRLMITIDERLEGADEMELLGLYLHNDLIIDKEMEGKTHVKLDAYKDDIDAYFDARGPKPTKRKTRKQKK